MIETGIGIKGSHVGQLNANSTNSTGEFSQFRLHEQIVYATFVDWFYGRILHKDMHAHCQFAFPDFWECFFEEYQDICVSERDYLGFNLDLSPEFLIQYVLKRDPKAEKQSKRHFHLRVPDYLERDLTFSDNSVDSQLQQRQRKDPSPAFSWIMNRLRLLCHHKKMKIQPSDSDKMVQDISEWKKQGLRLPPEADLLSWGDIKIRKKLNRYNDLYFNNSYLDLLKFLQTDNCEETDFPVLQRAMNLYTGIFAYVDVESQKLRYLLGPYDHDDDDGKEKPHIQMPVYWYNSNSEKEEGQFVHEDPVQLRRHLEVLYYGRSEANWQQLDFVRILQSRRRRQRTKFEKRQGMIYVPSGEQDACILCWLFLNLDDETRTSIQQCFPQSLSNRFFRQWNPSSIITKRKQYSFRIPLSRWSPGDGQDGELLAYREGEERDLIDWLQCLGLIRDNHVKSESGEITVTERGWGMVFWLEKYLTSLYKPGPVSGSLGKRTLLWLRNVLSSKEPSIQSASSSEFKVLGDSGEDFSKLIGVEGGDSRWLSGGVSLDEIIQFRNLAIDLQEHSRGDKKKEVACFFHALQILLSWKETVDDRNKNSEDKIKQRCCKFQLRCRFDLYIHLVIRAGDRGFHRYETSSRGWLVLPIMKPENGWWLVISGKCRRDRRHNNGNGGLDFEDGLLSNCFNESRGTTLSAIPKLLPYYFVPMIVENFDGNNWHAINLSEAYTDSKGQLQFRSINEEELKKSLGYDKFSSLREKLSEKTTGEVRFLLRYEEPKYENDLHS